MKNIAYILVIFVGCLWIAIGCKDPNAGQAIFELIPAKHSNINFENRIEEDSSFNMYAFMNIYTGGGVAVGDINNDGLEDLFFSGNRVPSKLYLNKGNLQFEDITHTAGINTNKWCAGASMVDINKDGLLDIYISVTGIGSEENRANMLFENKGNNQFEEKAEAYGLNDSRQIMHTSFFDYDKDGDLDAYMIVNPVNYALSNVNNIRERRVNGESESTDALYRNDGNIFTDVSKEAGILIEGYSLGIATSDINGDGWQDIYVSNDFLTNDILYINNQDGTFSNQASTALDHTSFAGMGNDISDFNNDGLPDIMVVDMLPEGNARRQTIIPESSYDKFKMTQAKGYEPQYTRNTLQLNNGNGTFSEIGQLAGIDKTDWSWSSLFADYDNDGDKDLLVTNGFLRDVGNLDYIQYQRENLSAFGTKEALHKKRLKAIQDLGAAKIENYIFENNNDLTFDKKNAAWGLSEKTCSNGAAFSDLDNDGDLEIIINNLNDKAFIYENKSNEVNTNNFLKVILKGKPDNPKGIGAKIKLDTENGIQFYQHNIYRGYGSSISHQIHFGLGEIDTINQLEVFWMDGTYELFKNIETNKILTVNQSNSVPYQELLKKEPQPLFKEIGTSIGLDYVHKEIDHVDFKLQPLLPHKHSQNGAGMAVGDVNGDGLDDMYIGGSSGYAGRLFIQNKNGQFSPIDQDFEKDYEDMGSLFFDADADGDQDLYIVSGGSSFPAGDPLYQDRFYLNDGKGNFVKSEKSLPVITSSGASVNAADYDKDGDLDLFVGGRIEVGAYPLPAQSYLLRNDSKENQVIFTDISNTLPNKGKIGLVTSALWTDYDNDNWLDLMLVGEWMPISFIKNEQGQLDTTKMISLPASNGWWNSLSAGDFDKDGDIDYLSGNLGLNSRFKASPKQPVCIYANDYDKNGRIDPVMCQFIEDESYITHPRDLLIRQINAMRIRFRSYKDYGKSYFDQAFTKEELEAAYLVKSENFKSSYIENLGDGKFIITPLPIEAQMAPVFGMLSEDFDKDGNLDVLLVGNSDATEVAIGNYDAFEGLFLAGNGKGNFLPKSSSETGFYIDSDAKGLSKLSTANGTPIYLASSNADSLRTFSIHPDVKTKSIPLQAADVYYIIESKKGIRSKQEIYRGSSYLSQSSRSIYYIEGKEKIEIINNKGEARRYE